ncbi:MAG: hypothetical protein L0154_02985 [Chloroflexi bacterium]|nr:hypothetical protein [Chloroflexota bacterium]
MDTQNQQPSVLNTLFMLPVMFVIGAVIWAVVVLLTVDDPPTESLIGPAIFIGFSVIYTIGLLLFRQLAHASQQRRQAILEFGTPTTAQITSVKQNLLVRANRQYIYTDVDVVYTDMFGHTHQTRQTMLSEQVQKMGLQTGDTVNIKYDTSDPKRLVIVEKV